MDCQAGGGHFPRHTKSSSESVLLTPLTPLSLSQLETMAKKEVKSSLLDNMIGVGDTVLLEPLNEETFIDNLKKRFDHNEIYVSAWTLCASHLLSLLFVPKHSDGFECLPDWHRHRTDG